MFYNFNPAYPFRSSVNQIINDPKFREFYERYKDKSPEEICKENNLDWESIKTLFSK